MIISSWIFIITTGFMHLLTTKHQLKFGGKHMGMDPGCCKSRAITEGVDDNMHHNLDVKPIPEKVLYINELSLADSTAANRYETKKQYEKAVSGETVSKGGVLPDDNVRIYVPMDLNEDAILFRLSSLYGTLGTPSWDNESDYSCGVRRIVSQLEIYDQVWTVRDLKNAVHFQNGLEPEVLHSRQGIAVAKQMIDIMKRHEGNTECFPYEQINELADEFGLEKYEP